MARWVWNRLSEEQRREFVNLYPVTSNSELAAKYGVHVGTIEHWGMKRGLKKDPYFLHRLRCETTVQPWFKGRRWTEEEEKALVEMYEGGYRPSFIARRLGRNLRGVSGKARALRKLGVLRTPRLRTGTIIGNMGERVAEEVLRENGFDIIGNLNSIPVYAGYDILALKNGEAYAVDVKFGNSCRISKKTIDKITRTGYIPLILYIAGDNSYFLSITISRSPLKSQQELCIARKPVKK